MNKKIKLIGIIVMLCISSTAFTQVKVENDGSLFVNSAQNNWGRANWTRIHYKNTCAYHLQNMYYSQDVFYVIGDGRVWARQAYLTSSDLGLKANVETIEDALATISRLRGVTYNRKYTTDSIVFKDGNQGIDSIIQVERFEPKEYGLIAQEVQCIVPEVVHKMQDSTLAISYSSIIPILIEAIKEQQNQIDELRKTSSLYESQGRNLQKEESLKKFDNSLSNQSALVQNNPNPFNESTTINYYISNNSKNASLNVYSINGNLVKSFTIHRTGDGNVKIDAGELKSGIYVYTLIVDGFLIDSKQMILTN